MDKECIDLCTAINGLPGIETYESCCGHGKYPYSIWVWFDDLKDILPLLYYLDSCHSNVSGWMCEAYTGCDMRTVLFQIIGPVGEKSYKDSIIISEKIRKFVGS